MAQKALVVVAGAAAVLAFVALVSFSQPAAMEATELRGRYHVSLRLQ
jgi:hypothetical protein